MRVVHAERSEDALLRGSVERCPDGLDDHAEDVGAEVGVHVACVGAYSSGVEMTISRASSGSVLCATDRDRREARAMSKEIANGDLVFQAAGECGM